MIDKKAEENLSSTPRCGVVIVHYKKNNDTLRALQSIEESNTKKLKLKVLIIDTSGDFKRDEQTSVSHKLGVIQTENRGYGAACNEGLKRLFHDECDAVTVSNADVLFDKECLFTLFSAALTDESSLYAPVLLDGKTKQIETLTQQLSYASARSIPACLPKNHEGGIASLNSMIQQGITSLQTGVQCGCCLCFTRKQYEKLKGFDEDFFLYSEDCELSLRALRKGYSLKVLLRAQLWHYHGGSTGDTHGVSTFITTHVTAYFLHQGFSLFSRNLTFSLLSPLCKG